MYEVVKPGASPSSPIRAAAQSHSCTAMPHFGGGIRMTRQLREPLLSLLLIQQPQQNVIRAWETLGSLTKSHLPQTKSPSGDAGSP